MSTKEENEIKKLLQEIKEIKKGLQLKDQLILSFKSLFGRTVKKYDDLRKKNLKLTATLKQLKLEKTQLELNYFWAKNKNNYEIGKLYKQFISYEHEISGWTVTNKTNVTGIDFICHKDNIDLVVLCKNWSKKTIIQEQDIRNFDESLKMYKIKNNLSGITAQGVFYTSTFLSDEARLIAEKLEIKVSENYQMPAKFPVIKAVFTQKRYYLPTDNNYNSIKLNLSDGDRYFNDVGDAENAGFHR